jgi:hypothetical protein
MEPNDSVLTFVTEPDMPLDCATARIFAIGSKEFLENLKQAAVDYWDICNLTLYLSDVDSENPDHKWIIYNSAISRYIIVEISDYIPNWVLGVVASKNTEVLFVLDNEKASSFMTNFFSLINPTTTYSTVTHALFAAKNI